MKRDKNLVYAPKAFSEQVAGIVPLFLYPLLRYIFKTPNATAHSFIHVVDFRKRTSINPHKSITRQAGDTLVFPHPPVP